MTTIDTPAGSGFSTTLGTFSAMTLYDAFSTEQRQRVLPFTSEDRDNRASFEDLLTLGREQKILTKPLTVDDLFPALG
jgi:hypothetical protein